MTLERFLLFVVQTLDTFEVPFMLTGSLAAAYHGSPRATQDVDLVIDEGVEVLRSVPRPAPIENSLDSSKSVSSNHGPSSASGCGMLKSMIRGLSGVSA